MEAEREDGATRRTRRTRRARHNLNFINRIVYALEEQFQSSAESAFRATISDADVVREPCVRPSMAAITPDQYATMMENNVEAFRVEVVGEEFEGENACTHCQLGHGIFQDCVAFDGPLGYSPCANCLILRRHLQCDHARRGYRVVPRREAPPERTGNTEESSTTSDDHPFEAEICELLDIVAALRDRVESEMDNNLAGMTAGRPATTIDERMIRLQSILCLAEIELDRV